MYPDVSQAIYDYNLGVNECSGYLDGCSETYYIVESFYYVGAGICQGAFYVAEEKAKDMVSSAEKDVMNDLVTFGKDAL